MSKKFAFILACLIIVSQAKQDKFSPKNSKFQINLNTNGSYSLSINDDVWLASASTFLRANNHGYDNFAKNLRLDSTVGSSGTDVLGGWQSIQFDYSLNDDEITKMNCTIKTYNDLNLVRFTQHFPYGTKHSSLPNYDSVITGFPSFQIQNILDKNSKHLNIGFLSFGGMMAGDMEKQFGKWDSFTMNINDGIAGGPLVLFNPATHDTLVISQMNEFMVTSLKHDKLLGGTLSYGIMGGIDEIPADYSVDFIVYYSDKGINKAMEEWGAALLKFYNKNTSLKDTDVTSNYLSYWTDNGAYYYWLTEDGKDYQTMLLDIVDYSVKNKIPFRSLQYDSWWYGARKGYRQGCFRWDGNIPSNRFPDTMVYVYNKTGLPITAHNKFWDYHVEYAYQNGGKYNFILDEFTQRSLPNDQSFWMDLFANATKWNLKTYEQDWLNHQTLDFTPLMTNITLGKTWLKQMGNAALAYNMTLQYCMSLSRHALQSLEIDAVTQIRVTNDYATNYEYGGEQWRLGVSSIFAAALGLAPFKDVYWTTGVQPGNPYGPKAVDDKVRLNSVVSTLTAGPVGPGDKIGMYINRDLIMRSCNDDGLLLKPSRPVTAIDAQIYAKALGKNELGVEGEVWSTYSRINDYAFGIVLATSINDVFQLNEFNVGFDVYSKSYYWLDGNNTQIYSFNGFDKVDPLIINDNCNKIEFCLYHVTPALSIGNNTVGILGEQSKWVPISPQRVASVKLSQNSLTINLNGSLNELVTMAFFINNIYTTVECSFISNNQMNIVLDLTSSVQLTCQ